MMVVYIVQLLHLSLISQQLEFCEDCDEPPRPNFLVHVILYTSTAHLLSPRILSLSALFGPASRYFTDSIPHRRGRRRPPGKTRWILPHQGSFHLFASAGTDGLSSSAVACPENQLNHSQPIIRFLEQSAFSPTIHPLQHSHASPHFGLVRRKQSRFRCIPFPPISRTQHQRHRIMLATHRCEMWYRDSRKGRELRGRRRGGGGGPQPDGTRQYGDWRGHVLSLLPCRE